VKTSTEVAQELGLTRRRIQQACQRLGIPKVGRDYVLTDEQIELIRSRIGKPGTALPFNESDKESNQGE